MNSSGLKERSYAFLIYDELEEYEEILGFIDTALQLDPDNSHLFNNRSIALSEIGRWGEAEEAQSDFDTANALNNT